MYCASQAVGAQKVDLSASLSFRVKSGSSRSSRSAVVTLTLLPHHSLVLYKHMAFQGWEYMDALHGGDESTIITGNSVHNERVEHLESHLEISLLA